MIYHGDLLRIEIGDSSFDNISKERTFTLTISTHYISGAYGHRTERNYKVLKSWAIQFQCLFGDDDFATLQERLNNMESASLLVRLKVLMGARVKYLTGRIIVTKVSFSGQGVGIVPLNVTAVGDGRLSVS